MIHSVIAGISLQMLERYMHAIPVKDRSALPNPMAEAQIVSFRREPKSRLTDSGRIIASLPEK